MRAYKTLCLLVLLSFLQTGHAEVESERKTARNLTLNILADPVHLEARLPALLEILKKSDADIIALQEVAAWFLVELEKQPWIKDYHSLESDGRRAAPGGLLILSKSPILKSAAASMPSRQRRSYLIVETHIKGVKVGIGTCHLESPLESGPVRSLQLGLYFKLLGEFDNALLLGDFNFGDGEQPETGKLPPDYVDSWRHTNGNEAGFTWNIEVSDMARKGSFPNEKSRRIDRILIRSEHFSPLQTVILGNESIAGQPHLFPSDHFGLLSTIRVK